MTPPSILTSVANPHVRKARALHQGKHRRESGLALAEGVKVVTELLDLPGRVRELFWCSTVYERPGGTALLEKAAAAGVQLTGVSTPVLARIADTRTPQGVVAVVALTPAPLMQVVTGTGDLLVLAGVQDPGNVGTLMRSAEAAGACGVIIDRNCADPTGFKAVRAAAASVFRLPWGVWDAPADSLADYLKSESFTVCVAQVDGDTSPADLPAGVRAAWVMGAEGQGVPLELAAAADRAIRIPMAPPVDSLNVAVAGSLLMFGRRLG
ncbi:MAG: RNA methyltransferase [Nitrospirota bacterium]|nr:RNA methyltransferase [Nitrospirota bacterium]